MHGGASKPQAFDPNAFDLNLLRTLDALLVTRSVSAAAQRLGLSQPATSTALAKLRTMLGDPLLVRKGNRMLSTPLADELKPRVARILEDISDTVGLCSRFDPAVTQRRFRIGASDYAALVVLAPLAQQLRQMAPGAVLEILAIDNAADTRLATREFDLVLADSWELREFADTEVLFHEYFVSMARADHPGLGDRPDLHAFLRQSHALISTRGISPGVVDIALGAIGKSRHIALTLPHYLVAPLIIAHTDLVMTLPSRIVDCFKADSRLRAFAPPLQLTGFDVLMAAHARSVSDPPLVWLKQVIRDVAQGIGSPKTLPAAAGAQTAQAAGPARPAL